MRFRLAAALAAAIALAGCAATTPPPRFEAVSPADPDAPESVTPPAAPALLGQPDAKAPPKPTPTPTPHHHHDGGRS
ncbi:MAG TPA: hypothetical protein VFQ51_14475 [Vicinamibacteria bacterium]|nr:hypothetical protein [Vicinamibacteria bacterium]